MSESTPWRNLPKLQRRVFRHHHQAAAAHLMRSTMFMGLEILATVILLAGTMAARRGQELFGFIALSAALLGLGYLLRWNNQWLCTYRLRLLPNGLRLTERNQTTNWLDPAIRLTIGVDGGFLQLQQDGRQHTINLQSFERRERAIIVEHCSQFLTPDEQRQHGAKWARYYASLISAPKPPPPIDVLKSCASSARIIAGAMIGGWLIVELLYWLLLREVDFSFDNTLFRQLYLTFLSAMVAMLAVSFGFTGLMRWFEQRAKRQPTASICHE